MSKKLPSEEELRTWTRASQEAFWQQRRSFWNRFKVTELQRECRKRGIWPGGDQPYIKDRLLQRSLGISQTMFLSGLRWKATCKCKASGTWKTRDTSGARN